MRFSFWPSAGQPWSDIVEAAQTADATGWDRVCIADHFMADGDGPGGKQTPTHEATALLAALAVATTRVRLASLVFGITYRHPAVLANWASTIDHISGGRLDLGLGAGWQVNEHEQYGIELGSPAARVDRFVEALAVITGLLRDETTSVTGSSYRLSEAISEPKPQQQPLPILIGSKGDRMMDVVARFADEWNMWAMPDVFAERSAALDRACDRAGRDPATIRRSAIALWFPQMGDEDVSGRAERAASSGRPVVAGGADELAAAVAEWAEAGADELIVPDFTLGTGSARAEAMAFVLERVAGR